MAYQALYRKYRPKVFEDVFGQEHITKTLQNQIKAGQISHAYLFTGTRGTGKTTVAKIFARAINCINSKTGSPCCECEICKSLDNPSNLDVLEIDAASNNRVDEIRDLRENVKFMPSVGKRKVYIIDEVHMLTDSAFNALLKTLEEPPEHVVFILATTEVHKLPATILSRCMRFDFNLVPESVMSENMQKIMKKEDISCTSDALKLIVQMGEGSVRDTLSIIDCISAFSDKNITYQSATNVLGISDNIKVFELASAILNKKIGDALEIINSLYSSGKNLSALSKDLTIFFRNLLIIKTCKQPNEILSLPEEKYKQLTELIENIQVSDLIECMKVFSSIETEMRYALSQRILLETATLIAITGDDSVKKN